MGSTSCQTSNLSKGGSDQLQIELNSIEVSPVITLDDAPFPAGQVANFGLLDLGATFFGTGSGNWPTFLVAKGQYRALYNDQSGPDIPANLVHLKACVVAGNLVFMDGFEGNTK